MARREPRLRRDIADGGEDDEFPQRIRNDVPWGAGRPRSSLAGLGNAELRAPCDRSGEGPVLDLRAHARGGSIVRADPLVERLARRPTAVDHA